MTYFTSLELQAISEIFHEFVKESPDDQLYQLIEDKAEILILQANCEHENQENFVCLGCGKGQEEE